MLDDNQIELELEYCCDIRKCKLTKIPIYITVNYIKGCTYEEGFENKYRPNIEKIVLNGVEKNKDDPLDINMGSEILIYFTEPPTNIDNFFSSVYDKNVDKIGSIDFSHFNSSIITIWLIYLKDVLHYNHLIYQVLQYQQKLILKI